MRRDKQTPEQRAIFAERAHQRELLKRARKRAKRQAAKRAAAEAATSAIGISKTSAAYRRRFPKAPSMTPAELRAFLAQAAINTARLQG